MMSTEKSALKQYAEREKMKNSAGGSTSSASASNNADPEQGERERYPMENRFVPKNKKKKRDLER